MNDHNKNKLIAKQVDFKRYAIVLLAVGVFFYLGTIIPTEKESMTDLAIMMSASSLFLAGSIFFFSQSKKLQQKLEDIDQV